MVNRADPTRRTEPGAAFRARDVQIFPPYADEVPPELLARACGPNATHPAHATPGGPQELVRVAKYQGKVIGLYAVAPVTPVRYQLLRFAVLPAFEHRGVGRWLLGHAIGLAETKGAREIVIECAASHGFFAQVGFERTDRGQRLTLTPE